MSAIACSVCYGSGYGVDGAACSCGCRPAIAAPVQPLAVPDGDEAFKIASQGCYFGNGDVARAAKEWFKAGYKAAPAAQGAQRPLFDRKLADLQQRGYEVVGRILHKEGQYALFDSSCRWLEKAQYQRLMHEQDGSLFAAPVAHGDASGAARDVIAERRRQIEKEGYSHEHDDVYVNDEIAAFAAFYVMPPAAREWPAEETGYGATWGEAIIPVDWSAAKPGDRRQELVKAGALVIAEIERFDRAAIAAGKVAKA